MLAGAETKSDAASLIGVSADTCAADVRSLYGPRVVHYCNSDWYQAVTRRGWCLAECGRGYAREQRKAGGQNSATDSVGRPSKFKG
jgi:hypothetical protein